MSCPRGGHFQRILSGDPGRVVVRRLNRVEYKNSNLPVVLAGAGGGTLTPGRYVKHGSKPMTNLFLSLADRMGVQDLERFGDSTDRLANC